MGFRSSAYTLSCLEFLKKDFARVREHDWHQKTDHSIEGQFQWNLILRSRSHGSGAFLLLRSKIFRKMELLGKHPKFPATNSIPWC